MAIEARAALSYHAKAVDGTEVVYGRDNMSAPLRVITSVLNETVDGIFMPDETRSGMLKKGVKPPMMFLLVGQSAIRSKRWRCFWIDGNW